MFEAGATMPTLSPERSAGGLMRDDCGALGMVESIGFCLRKKHFYDCHPELHYPKNSPWQISVAGPRKYTCSSQRTVCAPPGATTFTREETRLLAIAATATAHDPVPD